MVRYATQARIPLLCHRVSGKFRFQRYLGVEVFQTSCCHIQSLGQGKETEKEAVRQGTWGLCDEASVFGTANGLHL